MSFALAKPTQGAAPPNVYGCPIPTAFSPVVLDGARSFTALQEQRMAHECSDAFVHSGGKMKGASFKPFMMRHSEAYRPFHASLEKTYRNDNPDFNATSRNISYLVELTLARLEAPGGNKATEKAMDEEGCGPENIDVTPGNGCIHFLSWFLQFNNIPEDLLQLTIDQIEVDSMITLDELASFCGLIWATFLRGQFYWTVKLLDTLLLRMRRDLTFTADEEKEFSSIINFLIEIEPLRKGDLSPQMFRRWQAEATHSIENARSVLTTRVDEDSRAKFLKCEIFMKIILVCSGDARCLEEADSRNHDPLELMCGICTVVRPFMSMSELQDQICRVFVDVDSNWYHAAVKGFFTSTSFFDIITVTDAISEASSLRLRQANSDVLLSGSDELESVQSVDRMEALSFLFIAAHAADICAPPFAAAQSKKNRAVNALNLRNRIMREYILAITPGTTFLAHRPLLDAALSYIAWSPLLDVEVLPRVLATSIVEGSPCVAVAAGELTTLCQTIFSSKSAKHQGRLRSVVSKRVNNGSILGKIWSFQDNFCALALTSAITNQLKHFLYDTQEYSLALGGLANHLRTVGPRLCDVALQLFKRELRKVLTAPKGCEVMASPFVLQLGESINIGAVHLKDSFEDVEVRKMLRVCSCMSEIMIGGAPFASYFMEEFTTGNTKHMVISSTSAMTASVGASAAKFPIRTSFPSHTASPAEVTASIFRGSTRLVEHCIVFMNEDVKLAVSTLMASLFEVCVQHPEIAKFALSDSNAPSCLSNCVGPFISFKQKAHGLMMECAALTDSLFTKKAPNDTDEEAKAKAALLFRVVNTDCFCEVR